MGCNPTGGGGVGSLQPKGIKQNAVRVAGDTKPAIRLVVGDGASGHRTNVSINRTIVVTASCEGQLNRGLHGISVIILAGIPDVILLVLIGGIRCVPPSSTTCDGISQIYKEPGHDAQREEHPAVGVLIVVLIVIVISLHNERNAQEANCRERNRLQFPGEEYWFEGAVFHFQR